MASTYVQIRNYSKNNEYNVECHVTYLRLNRQKVSEGRLDLLTHDHHYYLKPTHACPWNHFIPWVCCRIWFNKNGHFSFFFFKEFHQYSPIHTDAAISKDGCSFGIVVRDRLGRNLYSMTTFNPPDPPLVVEEKVFLLGMQMALDNGWKLIIMGLHLQLF